MSTDRQQEITMNNRILLALATMALLSGAAFARNDRAKSCDFDNEKPRIKFDCNTNTQHATETCKDDKINVRPDCNPPKIDICFPKPNCDPKPPVCTPKPCIPVPPICPPICPPPHHGGGGGKDCEAVPEPTSMAALGLGVAGFIKRKLRR